ncbi:MAG: T9SS type A sorting domain-containing protein [Chitinophagaceae bacterium]|nr:T9SS type A sorting domain-containing protein [Chitinophagaceae bacterium]
MLKKSLLIILAVFQLTSLFAQALYPVSIQEKAANSTLIIEGKVVERTSFWNTAHTMIFTSNKIKIYKVFKGEVAADFVEVLTQGGSVGNDAIHASDLLDLVWGQEGIFFCHPNVINLKSPNTNNSLLEVYSSSQGFLNYNILEDKATDPFNVYNGISTNLYPLIMQLTGQSFVIKDNTFNVNQQKQNLANKTSAPSISSFTPETVNAGAMLDPTNNLLTINGTGFGTFTGNAAVIFNDANTIAGTDYLVAASNPQLSNLVVSWTDTEIKIKVPARAGSGAIKVRDNLGNVAYSFTNLTAHYGVINTTFNSGGTYYVKEFNLMDVNSAGGYTVYYSTSTSGGGVNLDISPTKQTFQRALTTWREISGFNVIEGGTTTTQVITGSTSECVIMYDNTNTGVSPLSAGTLAVCYSYSGICNVTNEARKPKFDVIIRNNGVSSGTTNFNEGPCPSIAVNNSYIDLESVLLHELGHALNLAHVNLPSEGAGAGTTNPGNIMHYSVHGSNRRITPDKSARDGATYSIQQQNNVYGNCTSQTEMVPLTIITEPKDECPLTFPSTPTDGGTIVNFDMVHATSNRFVDPYFTQIKCDGSGSNVTSTAFYPILTDNSGNLNISITNYIATPTSLTLCSSVIPGQLGTGFRFALYEVSTCPSAGAYPTPISCTTFTKNMVFNPITGLSANTNYLIFISAIENTKANFNMVISGSALPIKLSSFNGKVQRDYNNLDWTADQIINVNKIEIERSSTGSDFTTIGTIDGAAVYNKVGNFKDYKPTINSYYRLKIINNDGSVEYSKTINLKRTEKVLFSISPNPATTYADVQISSEVKGKYALVLYNLNGQRVYSKAINLNQGLNNHKINTVTFAKGVYRLILMNENNNNVYSNSLIVQ